MTTTNHTGLKTFAIFLISFLFYSCTEDTIDPVYLGSIHGVVLSKSSLEPIEEVEITTVPVTSVVFTDNKGTFVINEIPEGEYSVVTKADGYSRESVKVKVIRNTSTELGVKLSSSTLLAPAPFTPVPENGATNTPLTTVLKWAVDNNSDDELSYTVRLFESNNINPLIESVQLPDTTLTVENLKHGTTYYWYVDVVSSTGYITSGPTWRFQTIPFPENRIVFTSSKSDNYEIYSSSPGATSLVQLTSSDHYELRPLLSSKRDLIAFSSNKNVDYHIYTMNYNGSEVRQVTTLPIAGFHNQGIGFSWSPDNGQFIYSHYDKLYRIDRTGVDLVKIATAPKNRNFRSCDWTSVGNKIVVETIGSTIYDSEIYLMNANGTDTVKLVDNLSGIIQSPSFSIDGKQIMYTRDVSGYESSTGRQLDARIFIKDIESLDVIEVSGGKPNGTNDLQPRFSPDGAKIIFVNASNDGSGKKSIWIMNKDGSDRQLLIEDAEMPHWQ
ncbi:PD40 domain-containing protein [Fulvivirga sp. 29W222]|uniref:PD40 domain-containing protein n=1 Tax=Fulvivirga marina TaxID=2494733 RepID=A0A937G037_9BACT|nr:carboxypeptidase-like regulatory domain-containing protein [Fulvivirga marina]MBL6448093.1 PD40 domain-containing protein [Fulvivirga marina]